MKKFFTTLAVAAMLCGCASPASSAGTTTVSASADGFGGPVTVTLTMAGDTIKDCVIEGKDETPTVGGAALEELQKQVIAANGADIDGVSGATVTSTAVKEAVKAALGGGAGEVSYTPGTYTASAMGRNAAVTVSVTVSETAIEKVEVTDHAETMSVAGVALERVPAEIVAKQTTKIDSVTGATVTTNTIKTAVNDCLTQAGASVAALPEGYAVAGEAIEASADVVIIGAGGAGMSAAVTALQNGASVIILEKTSMAGGNTVVCGGVINAADTEWAAKYDVQTGEDATLQMFADMKAEDFPEEYQADFLTLQAQIKEHLAGDTSIHFDSVEYHIIQTYYYGLRKSLDDETIYGDYNLVSTMCKEAMPTVNWLETLGMEWQDVVTQATGGMWRRGHNPSMPKGESYVAVLEPKIEELGGEIMFETKAEELIVTDGKVTGVKAVKADGTEVTVNANKSVIMASGGYGQNLPMIKEYDNYWGNISDDIGCTNVSGETGDGIVMATALGADTTGMEFVQLMAIADPESGDLFTGLVPQSTANYILINQEGKRFVNDCAPRDVLAAAAIDNGGLFYMIADINIAENSRWLSNWEEQVERENTIMADTLEELAEKLGFNEEQTANFLASIEEINKCVDEGTDPAFGKTAFDLKVEEGPFFASPRKPAVHHTMGGLKINDKCEVLDTEGNAISGLFAAGEVCGGIHAGNRVGGNAVTDALVFGRIAGDSASK